MSGGVTFRQFVAPLRWLDGRPLAQTIEPYRWRIFDAAFQRDGARFLHSLILSGRAKKNWKTADLILACLFALMDDSPGGNQVYLVANDEGQAADDLTLAKKLIKANQQLLGDWLTEKRNIIERRDGQGFIEILPAQDAIGAHGKTYRLLAIDEIHGYRNWDLLEALAPDPTRPDTQQWITSYASLFHRPGVPLFDLLQIGRAGTDPRMLFTWYGGDFTTDPEFADKSPEERANPSMQTWGNDDYLTQQRRRLPSHKFRRLHLNLGGSPEGAPFQAESVMDAIERGVTSRLPVEQVRYVAFVDMSGGSNDDAVLGIAHRDADERAVIDRLVDQGVSPPFDPRLAIERFVGVLEDYGVTRVTGDRYAGETFRRHFERHGIRYEISERSKHELYEALEPHLNGHRVVALDQPKLEQQLLGLVWRGGRIDHPNGEHDDVANAFAGAVDLAMRKQKRPGATWGRDSAETAGPAAVVRAARGREARLDLFRQNFGDFTDLINF